MDFIRSLSIAASGLKAQAGRMRVLSENIANADSTGSTPGADPYRRKLVTMRSRFDDELSAQTVELGKVVKDQTAFPSKYDPGHPAADANGYVKTPNVNSLIEQTDLRDAQRSYEANISLISATRRMIAQTIGILRA